MKSIYILFVFLILNQAAFAQESATMEKRAREMHRVIGLDDKQQWIKFIKENYTQALIDKQQTMKVQSNDNGNVSIHVKRRNEGRRQTGGESQDVCTPS